MHRRPVPLSTAHLCWKCQWKATSKRRDLKTLALFRNSNASITLPLPAGRSFHATRNRAQSTLAAASSEPEITNPQILDPSHPIRDRLKLWQQELGGPNEQELTVFGNYGRNNDIANRMDSSYLGPKSDERQDLFERDAEEDEEDEDSELITVGIFLKPGDVVELSQSGREPVLAVFLQPVGMKSQFYSANGRWCFATLRNISFVLTGCINPALLKPLVPYLPTSTELADKNSSIQVPRDLGAPVQEQLERLLHESERIYRENAPILDNAYVTLADDSRIRMMTLRQIAKTLLAPHDQTWSPSPASLLAVRKVLHHNEFRFPSDARTQRLTNVFAIRAKNDVTLIETVHGWIRKYDEYIASNINKYGTKPKPAAEVAFVSQFIEKAQRIIGNARTQRQPQIGSLGPNKHRQPFLSTVWGEEFSSTDRQLISFFEAWSLFSQFSQMPAFASACSSVLHATNLYKDRFDSEAGLVRTMDRATGFLFLQELGVLTPHENRAIYDEELMLPTVRHSRSLELLKAKAELFRQNLNFKDSMADLRHDWGNTEVYCIDSADATEIDDGISISKVLGSPSEHWIHIHVANPTAFFDKNHVLSGLAAHMTETVYTPERIFPMLPAWVSQDYFSLGRNRPVITFSARVDENGEILEKKIQSGIVRKVTSLTYAQLCESLGEEIEKSTTTKLVVGGPISDAYSSRFKPVLAEHQLQNLRDLYTVARALWEKRKASGAIRSGRGNVDVKVFEKTGHPGLKWAPPSTDRSRQIQGDPIIKVFPQGRQDSVVNTMDASHIVEEAMSLAGHIAGSWCAERNIPAMYRGMVEVPTLSGQTLEDFKEQTLRPHLAQHGSLSNTVAIQYMRALGRSIAHSSPIPHAMIGYSSYIKATSPLRRFSDMIAHWQIEAALKSEALTGRRFDLGDPASLGSVLPFSQQQIRDSILTLSPREKIINQTKRAAVMHWANFAFARAFYSKEAELPETFRVVITDKNVTFSGHARGFLKDFSMRVMVNAPNFEENFEDGDEWEARILYIDVFLRKTVLEPIQLVYRAAEAT